MLRNKATLGTGHHLKFLILDLERKAQTVQDRIVRLRRELKLDSTWSSIHFTIAEFAMDTVEEISLRSEGKDQSSDVGEASLIDGRT